MDKPRDETFLRVVRGDPDPDELAALAVALLTGPGPVAAEQARRAAWSRPDRTAGFAGARSWSAPPSA